MIDSKYVQVIHRMWGKEKEEWKAKRTVLKW